MRKIRLNGPGLIVAVIAMIVALTGGAFAASGGLTSKEKKQVKSIAQTEAKKFQGTGPAGPQGPTGPKGDNGAAGSSGANGVSVTSTESAGPLDGTHCAGGAAGLGGSKFVSAGGTTYACNGKVGPEGPEGEPGLEGEPGEEGSPWTVDGTLPPGKVETGSWSFAATPADTAGVRVALPFFIPLAGPLEGHAHYQFDEDFFTFCEGSAEFPKPKAGELCVYVSNAETPEEITFEGVFSASFAEEGASPQGAVLKFGTPTINTTGGGTYAVRAPEAP
jgi:hypothetical protein